MNKNIIIQDFPVLGWFKGELHIVDDAYIESINKTNFFPNNYLECQLFDQKSIFDKIFITNWLRSFNITSILSKEEYRNICYEDDVTKIDEKLISTYNFNTRYEIFRYKINNIANLTSPFQILDSLQNYWIETSKNFAKNAARGFALGSGGEQDALYRKYNLLKNMLDKKLPFKQSNIYINYLISNLSFKTYLTELFYDSQILNNTSEHTNQTQYIKIKDIYIFKHFDGNKEKAIQYLTLMNANLNNESIRNNNKNFDNKVILDELSNVFCKNEINIIMDLVNQIHILIYINDYLGLKKWFYLDKHPAYCFYQLTNIIVECFKQIGEVIEMNDINIEKINYLFSKYFLNK